jgi:hypothetical protein
MHNFHSSPPEYSSLELEYQKYRSTALLRLRALFDIATDCRGFNFPYCDLIGHNTNHLVIEHIAKHTDPTAVFSDYESSD